MTYNCIPNNYINSDINNKLQTPKPDFDKCKRCRLRSIGFICCHSDGSCLKTDMNKILNHKTKLENCYIEGDHYDNQSRFG